MVLGKAMVCSNGLPTQTTVVSGTVLPQFAIQVLTGGCEVQFGEGVVVEIGGGSPEYSSVVTSYRLSIVIIGLSSTVFAVIRFVTDGETELI